MADQPDHPEWISYVAAAALAGVSNTTILHAIQRGELGHRPTIGRRPSVNRASVVEWSAARARAAEDAARKASDQARERALAHADTLPPASDHDWLTGPQAAEILGVSKKRVSQLVQADLIPHVRKGRRTWFRRDQLEVVAAARRVRFHGADPASGDQPVRSALPRNDTPT